jgi:hypothetical protein
MTDIEICQREVHIQFRRPSMLPQRQGHAEEKQVTRAPRGSAGRRDGDPENSKGLTTMTTGIVYLGARFQGWVNRLVARHLEAKAARFAR